MIEIRVYIYLNYLKSKGKKAVDVYEKIFLIPAPKERTIEVHYPIEFYLFIIFLKLNFGQ